MKPGPLYTLSSATRINLLATSANSNLPAQGSVEGNVGVEEGCSETCKKQSLVLLLQRLYTRRQRSTSIRTKGQGCCNGCVRGCLQLERRRNNLGRRLHLRRAAASRRRQRAYLNKLVARQSTTSHRRRLQSAEASLRRQWIHRRLRGAAQQPTNCARR